MLAQSVFPGSVVDGSRGPDSDIRHDSGPIPHAIGPSQRHTPWQPWKIMAMMNKPLSDRGGTSQILPPTLSRKGMTLWCSSVDNWWSALIRCKMSKAMRRHWAVRQDEWFFLQVSAERKHAAYSYNSDEAVNQPLWDEWTDMTSCV